MLSSKNSAFDDTETVFKTVLSMIFFKIYSVIPGFPKSTIPPTDCDNDQSIIWNRFVLTWCAGY